MKQKGSYKNPTLRSLALQATVYSDYSITTLKDLISVLMTDHKKLFRFGKAACGGPYEVHTRAQSGHIQVMHAKWRYHNII